MKTIIRNFLSVLRRFKVATVLNILGLSVAFAAFIVILMQINYERSFDQSYPMSDRIFRVELKETPGLFSYILPRGFIEEIIDSSPNIATGSLLSFSLPVYFTGIKNGEKIGFREPIQSCHPSLIKIFDFPIIEGDPNCLNEPDQLIIPQSLARKLFGKESAVGKPLHTEESLFTKEQQDFTVGAVYRDFPKNTQLNNVIYTAIDPQYKLKDFRSSNFACFLLLDNAESAAIVAANFNSNFDFKLIESPEDGIKLTAITDIYYLNESPDGSFFKSGNRQMMLLLFCIAILIIVVAIINFTNFSTALTPMRIKSINTQKVLGSSDSVLHWTLLLEAVMISLLAWVCSLLLVCLLSKTAALPFVEADLSLIANMPIVLLSGLIALLTGIVAGVYPSWYMVSFPPALVLKGSFGLSASGRKMRTVLICIQFVVSIMLIIGAGLIWLQNDYMKNFSLGFDKDQIAIVELNGDMYNKHKDTYVNRLKEFSGIEDVAFSMEKIASSDSYNTTTVEYKNKTAPFFLIMGSYNLLDVLGIDVAEGRDFSRADEQSEQATYIFNQAAYLNMDMETGDLFENWLPGRIVGFTGDVKLTSLRQGENNIAFLTLKSPYPFTVSYIRLKGGTNVHAAVSHIREALADIDPAYPFDVEFYDEVFDQLYHSETNLRSIITLFSLIAIMLSLVGVFGLVVFETQYSRKEIAIRKVHGSSVIEILKRLNEQYVYILCICFVIAAPVAYYVIIKWLENFTYKTPLYWWIFALAFLIVAVITTTIVTLQSWRAANANPVDSIKKE